MSKTRNFTWLYWTVLNVWQATENTLVIIYTLSNCVPTQGFKTFSVPTAYVFYTTQGQYIFHVSHNKSDMRNLEFLRPIENCLAYKCGTRALG